MQVNIALDKENVSQAQTIRKVWYPYTTGRQTRDAFIFNECIDRFDGDPEDLLKIVEREEGGVTVTVQRMLTIKVDSNNRLRTLATSIGKSIAATYRALIAYTIEKIGDQNNESNEKREVGVSQLAIEKLLQLDRELACCEKTLKEIKVLLKEDIEAYTDDNRAFELLSDRDRSDILESMLPNMSLMERADFLDNYNDDN